MKNLFVQYVDIYMKEMLHQHNVQYVKLADKFEEMKGEMVWADEHRIE